jgi:hypothetical protein
MRLSQNLALSSAEKSINHEFTVSLSNNVLLLILSNTGYKFVWKQSALVEKQTNTKTPDLSLAFLINNSELTLNCNLLKPI